MALGAIVVVAVSILAAITFLPVMMRLFGGGPTGADGRVARGSRSPGRCGRRPQRLTDTGLLAALDRRRDPPAGRVGRSKRRRPARPGHAGAVTRVRRRRAAPVPRGKRDARGHRAGREEARRGLRRSDTDHRGTRLGHDPATRPTSAALAGYARSLAEDPEAVDVSGPVPSRDGRSALIQVVPRHDPESPEARAMVGRFREGAGAGAIGRVAHVEVGGATATVEDFK